MSVKVAVNGYGTIGKRVADAVARQPDLTLIGVSKARPTFEARRATELGYPLYLTGSAKADDFRAAHIPTAGTVAEMVKAADVVVDCAPEKVGRENRALYDAARVRAIFQGGEKADVAEVSFNALSNFAAAKGKRRVRVVSCNTTGLSRAAAVLTKAFGVDRWDATIVRRAADPAETDRGPINGILPTFTLPSHHGPDVKTIFPQLSIQTTAVVVPTTLMHVHVNHVRLTRRPGGVSEIVDAFRASPRFQLFSPSDGVLGTPQVIEWARDRGVGTRPDVMANVLWENGFGLDGNDVFFFQGIHQESIVVPENIDAIRAMFGLTDDAARSIAETDKRLGIDAPKARAG